MKYLKYAKVVLIAAGFLLSAYFFVQEGREEQARTTIVQLGEDKKEAETELTAGTAAEPAAAQAAVQAAGCTCAVVRPWEDQGTGGSTAGTKEQTLLESMAPAADVISETAPALESPAADSHLVNLNTAGKEELMTLKGIGESRAEAIMAYREDYGPFAHIEEIMNVSGIKEAAFEKIKNDITV